MSITEESQEFVTVSELVGRTVKIYSKEFEVATGTLHAVTNHGVLIKATDTGDYELYPWHQLNLVAHEISQIKTKVTEDKSKEESSEEWRPVIVESPSSILTEETPEKYSWDWEDSDEEIALISDDEDDDAIKVNTEAEEITVYYSKDLELAKTLAKKLNIKKIIKDYQP